MNTGTQAKFSNTDKDGGTHQDIAQQPTQPDGSGAPQDGGSNDIAGSDSRRSGGHEQ